VSATGKRQIFDASTDTETDPTLRRKPPQLFPRPFLFLLLEPRRPLTGGARFALGGVDQIVVGRGHRRECIRRTSGGEVSMTVKAPSSYLSSEHARIHVTSGGWMIEDLDSRNGTFVNGNQVSRAILNPGDIVALGQVLFSIEYHDVPESWDADPWSGDLDLEQVDPEQEGLLTLAPSLGLRLGQLREEARRTGPVTVVGETGTGKELLARAIHRLSRRPGPYIAINCGAMPRELIQSELFGHAKGAFTGAPGSPGYVRDADRGTLLLDEIVEAPAEVQRALLRVIQERAVTAVGATRAHAVDVRFIAAAQRSLADSVVSRGFRPDLRARLEAFVFELPPLRQRMEDIGLLVAHALRSAGVTEKENPRLSPEAAWRLLRYGWPLNIRELVLSVQRAWANSQDGVVEDKDLPEPHAESGRRRPDLKEQLIVHLRLTGGNVTEVARRMGRSRQLIHRWIKRFQIVPETFRC
jgi:transcriptional regulator with GAF, ATPase, and Fis domain